MKKYNLFGTKYSDVDYKKATDIIIENAKKHRSYGVSALAVHGLIESILNSKVKMNINNIHMIVPDGQPIRWALNSFYKIGLKDRVYGPHLTLYVLRQANINNLGVYLYGSTKDTIEKFSSFITKKYPNISISGVHHDRFREATIEEDFLDINKINRSGANLVLVGRGCPRQEIWVAGHIGKINAVMMAVGAAFDFHAGTVPQAPKWMQDRGLEWFFRLLKEPRRLWKRYLITNSIFIYLYLKHKYILRRPTE